MDLYLITLLIFIALIFIFFIKYTYKKIIKYRKIFLKNGFDGAYYYFINKNIKDTGLNSFIDKKRRNLTLQISKETNQTIYSGPYQGVKLQNLFSSYKVDLVSILLGTYEIEIQRKIIELSKNNGLKNFVDLGAGEGFHIISLIKKNHFNRGLAYEINKQSRNNLEKNLALNNLENKIEIYNEANFNSLKEKINKNDVDKTLFLIDIEGHEFNLFNESFCEYFKESFFIIEDHHFNILDVNKKNKFYDLVKNFFNIEILKDTGKDPFELKILDNYNDDEKYLMMSEGRPETMQWLILKPKKLTI